MPRTIKLLTAVEVDRIKVPGMHPVGPPGLYLQVMGSASRSWIYRYTMNHKTRWAGLGSRRDVTLEQARLKQDEIRIEVKRGNDPVAARKLAKQAEVKEPSKKPFREWFEAFLTDNQAAWRNAKHRQQWRNTIETYAFPVIGDLSIDEIKTSHILEMLRPLWTTKHETARRVRGRVEAVIDYASDPDDKGYQNPAKLTKLHIKKKLPKRIGPKSPQHHPAMLYGELPSFMEKLREREGIAARCLEFLILTAARTGEATGGRWDEIDLAAKVWTVPDSRMKAGKPHRVPLNDRAVAILNEMAAIRSSEFIFPGMRGELSNMSLTAVLKRMDRHNVTVHGFRATFKMWATECTNHMRELAELSLAHAVGTKVEKAYRRDADMLERRRPLMSDWGNYCTLPPIPEADKVVQMRR